MSVNPSGKGMVIEVLSEMAEFRTKELKEAKEEGRREEHLLHCGWCRMGMECPYK